MKSATLSTPFLDSERNVRSVNFFNGRLLTAEDMKKEQEAEAAHRRRLARMTGEGVAQGLRVTIKPAAKPRSVEVEAGVAINVDGQIIELPEKVEIALQPDTTTERASGPPALLKDCAPPESGVFVTGTGLYLLSVGPGAGLEGSVPVSGLSNPLLGGRVRCCSAKHSVEGPTFRLTELNRWFPAEQRPGPDKLRSAVARRMFAVEKARSFVSNPFQAAAPAPVDRPLARLSLSDDARNRDTVPLAILYWTAANGLEIADNWSVRRRPSGPVPERGWPAQTGDARAAEAEAMWWQFQDHVQSLTDRPNVKALEHFTYLPAAGVLPMRETPKGGRAFDGFSVARFFDGLQVRDPIYVEGARVEHLLRSALAYPPMDLEEAGASRMVWLYRVRENDTAVDAGTAGVTPYAIFTTGHVPYFGEARFDVGRWDYATFT